MIISKDLFIFGEHIFATIIPEVQAQSIPLQQQQEQSQQKVNDEKLVDPQKKLGVEEIEGGGSLNQQETVAVVFVGAPTTGKFTTKKLDKVPDQSLLAKEVEQNLDLKEKQHQNKITSNGSIKTFNTTTTTIINNIKETGSIDGKKINLQQKQKKAKETKSEDIEKEVNDKIRRTKEKLLVDNGNEYITEEETTATEKEEEKIGEEKQTLIHQNLANKLKIVSSSQVEGGTSIDPTNYKLNNTQDSNARNEDVMVTTPFITKNQEQQTPQQRTIQLNFQNIHFSHGDRKILNDISGHVSPGEVLAVMGPSGSGKTTLLDCLSSQRRPESGKIFLNREHLSKKWRRKICYVLQEEIFFSGLTLRETVMYTAMLRLPEKMAKQDKIKVVDRILQELELIGCEQTKFGDYMSRGLSGGEKKRANIACELLTNPLLMLLDEPTSGLDSHAALSLMRVLKRYATEERKTVVISVHQPSSQMFHMFDKLLLLYNGQTAYFGDVKNIYQYFENIGVAIKTHYNPADFLLEQLKSHPDTREKLFSAVKETQCNAFNHQINTNLEKNVNNQYSNGKSHSSLERKQSVTTTRCQTHKNGALINNIINTYYKDHHTVLIMENDSHPENDLGTEEQTVAQQLWCDSESNFSSFSDSTCLNDEQGEDWLDYPTHFVTQLNVLSSRSFKEAKPRMLSKLNWFQTVGLALMAGAIWFQIPRTEEYLHDLQGWMFFSQTYWMLFALFGALNSFPSEREVISKERRSGAYRLSAYYLAKMFAELPLVITLPTVYLIISYPMLGCSSIKLFFLMLVFLLLNTIVAQSVGFFIGAYCMDMNVSITLSALYTLATQLFGGYLSSRIPEGLSWIRYTSMIHYAYQNMQILEFREGPKISCSQISSYEICKSNSTDFIPYEHILKAQNSSSPLWLNTLILMMFFLVFRGLGYAVLRYIRCPNAS